MGRLWSKSVHRSVRCLAGALLLAASIGAARAEPAIGQFEVKDLDAEPGSLEFQSQNAHSWGQPKRRTRAGDDELLFDENSVEKRRHALELEAGITRFFRTRVGIEYEQERIDEPATIGAADQFGELELMEFALEGVLVLLPVKTYGAGVSLLVEYEHPTDGAEAKTLVAGPLFEAKSGRWSAIANVTFVHFFGGDREDFAGELARDDKWDLAYATQVRYQLSDAWGLTVEAYGTFDRLAQTGRRSESAIAFGDHDQHRAGPIIYHTRDLGVPTLKTRIGRYDGSARDEAETAKLTLGAGLLVGLNDNTPDATLKWSVEVEF